MCHQKRSRFSEKTFSVPFTRWIPYPLDTLPPGYPTPIYTILLDILPHRYPTPWTLNPQVILPTAPPPMTWYQGYPNLLPQKGNGSRDTLSPLKDMGPVTWDQRYPTPPVDRRMLVKTCHLINQRQNVSIVNTKGPTSSFHHILLHPLPPLLLCWETG